MFGNNNTLSMRGVEYLLPTFIQQLKLRKMIIKIVLIYISSLLPLSLLAQNGSYSASVFFESDKFCLSKEEQEKLDDFMKIISPLTIYRVTIWGYCDDLGSKSHNDTLSKKRAKQLENTIKGYTGNNDIKFHYEGKGELPIKNSVNKNYALQRENNRRVDIVFETRKALTNKAIPNKKLINEIESDKLVLKEKSIPKFGKDSTLLIKGNVIVLDNVNFEPGTSKLFQSSYLVLQDFLGILKENKEIEVLITGHIVKSPIFIEGNDGLDSSTGKYNLSTARAKSVYDFLIKNGISEGRLSYKGLGFAFPTGKGSYFDRRVEVKILNN